MLRIHETSPGLQNLPPLPVNIGNCLCPWHFDFICCAWRTFSPLLKGSMDITACQTNVKRSEMVQEQVFAYWRPQNNRPENNVEDCIGNHLEKFRDASQCCTVTAFRTLSSSRAQIEVLPSSRANPVLSVRTGPKRSMPSQSIHLESCESRSMALSFSSPDSAAGRFVTFSRGPERGAQSRTTMK